MTAESKNSEMIPLDQPISVHDDERWGPIWCRVKGGPVHSLGGDMRLTQGSWKEHAMSFEDKEAELGLLFGRMQKAPEDWGEVYEQIRQKLNELKAYGMPLPEDLVEFERDLEAEFAAEKEDNDRRGRMDKVIEDRAKS